MEGVEYSRLQPGSGLIRLLELLPPDADPTALHCRLHTVSLASVPDYKALSYAWKDGDYDDYIAITCNDRKVQIPWNLYVALLHQRYDEKPIQLWVDYLCINQRDNNEKTYQVNIMKDIYEQSSEVVIWLGQRAEHDDVGEWLANQWQQDERTACHWNNDESDRIRVDAYVKRFKDYQEDESSIHPKGQDVFGAFCLLYQMSQGDPSSKIEFYHTAYRTMKQTNWAAHISEGLFSILARSWWERTWVVQETVVAKKATIHYDILSAPWTMFSRAATNYMLERATGDVNNYEMRFSRHPLDAVARFVMEIESTMKEWRDGQSCELLSLLQKFRNRKSSDSRDKVFAFLGIANQLHLRNPVLPDYNLAGAEVFRRTTIQILSNTGSLSILAGPTQRELDGMMPSWVIDWSFSPGSNDYERLKQLSLYNADSHPSTIILHEPMILETKALLVDVITSVAPVAPEDGMARLRNIILQWYETGWHRRGRYGTTSNAFWRVVCGDVLYMGHSDAPSTYQRATEAGRDGFNVWREDNANKRNRNTSIYGDYTFEYAEPEEKSKVKNSFHYAVQTASGARRYFTTRNNYVGVGPLRAQAGDYVFVLSGSRVPFILRPSTRSHKCNSCVLQVLVFGDIATNTFGQRCEAQHEDCFQLIGDAYVHGIMDGQVRKSDVGNSMAPQTIFIV